MKSKSRLLLLSLVALIAAGGALAIWELPVLEIVNSDRGRRFHIPMTRSQSFALSYIHSIYLQPAAEEFEVGEGEEMILRGVRTRSPAVAAYYGFEEGQEYYPVNLRMKSFSLRLAMSTTQTLFYGEEKLPLGELGEKGDRLEVRLIRMSWGSYLLSWMKREKN